MQINRLVIFINSKRRKLDVAFSRGNPARIKARPGSCNNERSSCSRGNLWFRRFSHRGRLHASSSNEIARKWRERYVPQTYKTSILISSSSFVLPHTKCLPNSLQQFSKWILDLINKFYINKIKREKLSFKLRILM